jgi:hypothetical protein
MRETRLSGSEGGGANSIVSPYPYSVMRLARNEYKILVASRITD